ncbi:HEAVY METAL ATPASE 6, HEAVY METAL ASSOCIATED PROTEIN 38, Arabidopsis thaliana heavy metal ATPase 6 [Hibiscus trionum]|uniref:HEAVY METAL ATPASE 6, HEAVY METAL ASSOCIATED PROTEIN 38, Arabidopsis thaliana heavy metal ATPase 6 n=1 Tax=Hibiscus trionum TaxID=183268 RepID=A0A9W7LS24_HIBTR|nr:HEAVY METAL ATPASE 6, HEAVY METAL ASSOCIATED PROTEIN 38, Arabidopsis thaliana heavy metal ATPase 6 [Hibiscus trionum]
MDSALSVTVPTLTLFSISRALNRHLCHNNSPLIARCIRSRLFAHARGVSPLASRSYSSPLRRSCAASFTKRLQLRLECVASSAAYFGTAGGGVFGGGDGSDSGGGGGGTDGGDSKAKLGAGAADELSALSPDVIILDVGGMTCGGCAASVKRILENQPQVSSASVNLTTETAIVWPVSEAKVLPNWQKELGEALARQLTKCGFSSNLRDSGGDNFFKIFERKMDEKRNRLKESGRELAVSWALCAVCLIGHLAHFLGAKASWMHAFHSTGFHLSLSLFTLLGPGRQLIFEGVKSLFKGAPNMNTLVGLGALSSFAVSSLAVLIPKLGWKAFFEEPIMLIAFVLLGRNLEQRAKIKATSDMTGLLSSLPSQARLMVDGSIVEVPCNSLAVGDQIVVLPGDRVPADGIVRAGRSTIDESSFTGEPMPVTKEPGSQVAAGSINLNGTLTIEVRRPGGETAMGDIVRLVEEAQSREAPVQRLADKVAGHFTYGVMALSVATFMFWNLFGAQIIPASIYQGSAVSLALQLSCSVLVVACPCALGLATPTAMLVGTSLGATRGLLLRGGNILEKFSMVNAIVFDKTGTLTIGRPVVTKIITPSGMDHSDSRQHSDDVWSEDEVLKLAAAVESNTIHPVGKAIVEAARAVKCPNIKVVDGTFVEEPGSGAVAVVDDKTVSVGTFEWVQRHGVGDSLVLEADEELRNKSVVYVGVNNTLAGLIYFEDQIREDAKHVIDSLHRQGIGVYMLSGDKRSTAEYVASIVGIPKDKVLAEVKPDEKRKFVSLLQTNQNVVAMVGDGINDAAALASAHIGIGMGGGVGAASEVSSIVLMGDRLSQLLDALALSRLTMKTVKQNLWWAFGYNLVGIPIAAGTLLPFTGTMLTPSIAGALMGLSSIGVVTNSLLLRFKFSLKQQQVYGSSPQPHATIDINTAEFVEDHPNGKVKKPDSTA